MSRQLTDEEKKLLQTSVFAVYKAASKALQEQTAKTLSESNRWLADLASSDQKRKLSVMYPDLNQSEIEQVMAMQMVTDVIELHTRFAQTGAGIAQQNLINTQDNGIYVPSAFFECWNDPIPEKFADYQHQRLDALYEEVKKKVDALPEDGAGKIPVYINLPSGDGKRVRKIEVNRESLKAFKSFLDQVKGSSTRAEMKKVDQGFPRQIRETGRNIIYFVDVEQVQGEGLRVIVESCVQR